MVIRFLTQEKYHNKTGVGSTRIRVHNLIKKWREADLYTFGEKADVMIFQKVYCTYDYKLPNHYPGIRILDACDLDWKDTPDIYIKETLDGVHAVAVPTENMAKLFRSMTETPVHIIPDRFIIEDFPERKHHRGTAKRAVWFGYVHNAELLKFAVPALEKRGYTLTVISNEDPAAWRWAADREAFAKRYTYVKYDQDTLYAELQKADIAVLPKGFRPEDRYKSENRTIIAQLCGLPVVNDADGFDAMRSAEARNDAIDGIYEGLKKAYDCNKSVEQYREMIRNLITE